MHVDARRDFQMRFKNFHKQLPCPFVIYAAFESITPKLDKCNKNDSSYT